MQIEDIQNLYRHDFGSFIQCAFGILHPHTVFQDNWHIHLMAHYLKQVSEGKIKRLIINMPPRMLKSECVSIAWPAWELGRDPRKKILCLHASKSLGRDLDDACFELMTSRRYRSLFPGTLIKSEQDRLVTSFKGRRQFMPIMGKLTGLGADIIIIDDPMSSAHARDAHERQRLNEQFDDNILQRLNDKKTGAIVLVMQRLHKDDLTAHLLSKNDKWEHLNLSAVAMEDECWDLPYKNVHRRLKGEALHPERESLGQLAETMMDVGGHSFAYQYLQGTYEPRFGETGEGGVWLHPMREGEFYDCYENKNPNGLCRLNELHFMLPRVFGIGEDPIPENARAYCTQEEMDYNLKRYREVMLEHQRKVASGELDY